MKQVARLSFILLFLLITAGGCKTRKVISQPNIAVAIQAPANFRIVGYMISRDIANGQISHFDITRLNYLNVFFNGPKPDGKFKDIPHLDSTITVAHTHHIKVLATIGNAIDPSLLSDTCRAELIDSLVSSVVELHLDGIDVDLEGDHIDKNYEGFVGDLSAALKAQDKLITAAIATWESVQLSDKALSYFDFLNVMTYDATGPWNIKQRGPHSPYSMAVADLDFWTNFRCITKNKLNLGLPFYGYGFEPAKVREFNYNQLVKQFPGAELNDSLVLKPDTTLYYNGIATIKKKTNYAIQNAGGVMIWELMGDADDEKSLLKAVDDVVYGK